MSTDQIQTVHNEVTTGEPLEKGGYFVGYNLVIRNAMKVFKLSAGEFSCLTMLLSYAGADKDKCFPSQEALAEDLDTTPRNVRRYLDALLEKGVIKIYNRQNRYNLKISNIYDLSPCLQKIRDLFCQNDDSKIINEGVKVIEKARNNGQDRFVLSETTDRTDSSGQIGQIRPTTNNTIQITTTNNLNMDNIDDDMRTVPTGADSAVHNEESINSIISTLREATKDNLTDRSYKAIVRKVMDKYNQGKIGEGKFRDYLVTALANKIEELELRRQKDQAKQQLDHDKKQRIAARLSNHEVSKDLPFYNWLEQ